MCDAWKRLSKYRHQHVEILTTVKDTLCGFVHAVDPDTGNVVLLSDDSGSGSSGSSSSSKGIIVYLVIASSIEDVCLLSSCAPSYVHLPLLCSSRTHKTAPVVASIEPLVLVNELRARRIDASIISDQHATDGTASCAYIDIFSGVARIVPPFYPQSVRSTNHNVLTRIRAVIQHIYDHAGAEP